MFSFVFEQSKCVIHWLRCHIFQQTLCKKFGEVSTPPSQADAALTVQCDVSKMGACGTLKTFDSRPPKIQICMRSRRWRWIRSVGLSLLASDGFGWDNYCSPMLRPPCLNDSGILKDHALRDVTRARPHKVRFLQDPRNPPKHRSETQNVLKQVQKTLRNRSQSS